MHKTNPAKHDENRHDPNRRDQDCNNQRQKEQNRKTSSTQRKEAQITGGRRGSRRPHLNDTGERDFNDLTREEIVALVKKVAEELGHRPNVFEFWQMAKAKKEHIRRLFGSYRELVEEAGFEATGPGYYITTDQLMEDWAAVAGKLGKAPTVMQYNKAGKYSHRAFRVRWSSWHDVPAAVVEWAQAKWPDRQWDDAMRIARKYAEERRASGPRAKKYNKLTSTDDSGLTSMDGAGLTTRRKKDAGAVYGRPIMMEELATAPTNEAGVLFLFGALAKKLGYMILRVQTEFPDIEAIRCVGEKWKRVRIELEYESKNFLLHKHDVNGCELIVCWTHNWPSAPVEVVELSMVMGR
ncbi:MAG TPA: hypothetical protein VLN58_12725 [Verrucomicrobiae bacterium]|nr:hypothetical protein [Verrucomicrobiae bacterium]